MIKGLKKKKKKKIIFLTYLGGFQKHKSKSKKIYSLHI